MKPKFQALARPRVAEVETDKPRALPTIPELSPIVIENVTSGTVPRDILTLIPTVKQRAVSAQDTLLLPHVSPINVPDPVPRKHTWSWQEIKQQGSLFFVSGLLCLVISSIIGAYLLTPPASLHRATSPHARQADGTVHSTHTVRRHLPIKTHVSESALFPTAVLPSTPSPALLVTPASFRPSTCSFVRLHLYVCSAWLVLRADAQQAALTWYSFNSNTAGALFSPSNGVLLRGNSIRITITLTAYCPVSTTLFFHEWKTTVQATALWSC